MAAARRVKAYVILAALALGSCAPESWFPEYVDPDGDLVNLVEDRRLSETWVRDSALTGLGPTADLYFDFLPADDVTLDPPVADAEIMRMEYKSLLPYGDFESETPADLLGTTSQGWRMYVPPADDEGGQIHEVVAGTNPRAIDGNTLHYKATSVVDRLDFALTDPIYGATDGFLEGAAYLVRFSFRSGDTPVVFELNDDEAPLYTWSFYSDSTPEPDDMDTLRVFPTVDVTTYQAIAPQIEGASANYRLSFGSIDYGSMGSIQDAYVDNLRLVRVDISPRVQTELTHELSLPIYSSPDESYTLVSGRYRFSVWVHDDPTVGTVANRYASSGAVLEISGGGRTTRQTYTRDESAGWVGDGDPVDGWVKLSVESEALDLSAPTDPYEPVLTLRISPTDWVRNSGLNADAGSLLVSSPSLELLSALE